jgi:aminoglycoside 3-N-acetyltransferase
MWLLKTVNDVAGKTGTVCMPTHPLYKADPGFMYDKSDLELRYSVRRTPSRVGLLTELFRRQPGTQRSRHPLSSLAARGPQAEALLEDNLNDEQPLPHGIHSGYYRFCQSGGTVISIGLSLVRPMTILHVAEEAKDEQWPTAGFFYRRRFEVEDENGRSSHVVVRERRPEFARSLTLKMVHKHFLDSGILREGAVGDVRVDTVRSKALLDSMSERQRHSCYPYLWPALARIGRPSRAAFRSYSCVSLQRAT